jgi:hypothetical protein
VPNGPKLGNHFLVEKSTMTRPQALLPRRFFGSPGGIAPPSALNPASELGREVIGQQVFAPDEKHAARKILGDLVLLPPATTRAGRANASVADANLKLVAAEVTRRHWLSAAARFAFKYLIRWPVANGN